MSDFFLLQMDDDFGGGVCFDNRQGGGRGASAWRSPFLLRAKRGPHQTRWETSAATGIIKAGSLQAPARLVRRSSDGEEGGYPARTTRFHEPISPALKRC
jgi:hypothetical protein